MRARRRAPRAALCSNRSLEVDQPRINGSAVKKIITRRIFNLTIFQYSGILFLYFHWFFIFYVVPNDEPSVGNRLFLLAAVARSRRREVWCLSAHRWYHSRSKIDSVEPSCGTYATKSTALMLQNELAIGPHNKNSINARRRTNRQIILLHESL